MKNNFPTQQQDSVAVGNNFPMRMNRSFSNQMRSFLNFGYGELRFIQTPPKRNKLEPKTNKLEPKTNKLPPKTNKLQPKTNKLHPKSNKRKANKRNQHSPSINRSDRDGQNNVVSTFVQQAGKCCERAIFVDAVQ